MLIWRKIVRRVKTEDAHGSLRSHGRMLHFNYHMVPVTTLHLECGHTKVYRGDSVPKKKVLCSSCPPCT